MWPTSDFAGRSAKGTDVVDILVARPQREPDAVVIEMIVSRRDRRRLHALCRSGGLHALCRWGGLLGPVALRRSCYARAS
jgi:hypothetical protein